MDNLILPKQNKTTEGKDGQFIFATQYPQSALAYAIKTEDMASCDVGKDAYGRDITFVTIVNRTQFLSSQLKSQIFRLNPNRFINVIAKDGVGSAEWISEYQIKVEPDDVISVPGIKTVMDFGVQVFFAKDGIEKPKVIDFLLEKKPSFEILKRSELFTLENVCLNNL